MPPTERWRSVRRYLNEHRHDLAAVAAELYPGVDRVAGTPLLGRADWSPAEPIELTALRPAWSPDARPPAVTGTEAKAWPICAGHSSYAAAMAAIDPPRLFENRSSYRLLDVALGERRMRYGPAAYFDGVNVGEAVAHELAEQVRRGLRPGLAELPLRASVGDPTLLSRRPVLPAISMLTLRRDAWRGELTFVLHWRDPARVAHGGGLYQVMPVGVFQPADEGARARERDLDLWRCAVREYSEEFLGTAEDYGEAFDYEEWPFYRSLTEARDRGLVRSYVLGMGVDPLTFATDLLAVTVLDAPVYDDIFAGLVEVNPEGRVVAHGARGFPFERDVVERLTSREPMQAAGAAVLALAWRHRDLLRS
ncbi:hypothetical protein Sme01_34330 [Sphaerisporangium melleum]|uniref:Uncharacterized protein n=1 Tax=Sphaerisporangium melleum TaxID=321316 RepID=A0A917QXQ7_9ACTN|nr:transcriptional regulator [Sphaerisporangium melleum]GGK74760.1 hypothetical protein GCM10007964_17010 [Sphaerisporangium melleum]GII70957.1 hypothetical protein Sme01_34330 [Sphaerisporangium melleum]